MAFERLQKLGPAKWQKITNEIMRGTPCMALARTIQMEWHDFQDVAEKTLTQQLNRLRIQLTEKSTEHKSKPVETASGEVIPAKQVQSIAKGMGVAVGSHWGGLKDVTTFSCADELTWLSLQQRQRVERLLEVEKKMAIPLQQLNEVMRDYSKFLQDLQKMRFDLGIDQFQGVVTTMRGQVQTASMTLPDGTNVQKQVYEAYEITDQIFQKHGIEA